MDDNPFQVGATVTETTTKQTGTIVSRDEQATRIRLPDGTIITAANADVTTQAPANYLAEDVSGAEE